MRKSGLTVGALLVAAGIGLTGLGAGGAFAASVNPQKALSSGLGGASCGYFMSLGKAGQDHLVSYLIRSAPGGTLATIPPATSGGASTTSSGSTMGTKTPAASNTGPLKASTLVAACQAATDTSTLRSAYQKFAMGSNASSSQ